MRLHRLRLAAFGPYATEQVIDFRAGARRAVLLEGPTGRKTTISTRSRSPSTAAW
jgi:hypothetical protein